MRMQHLVRPDAVRSEKWCNLGWLKSRSEEARGGENLRVEMCGVVRGMEVDQEEAHTLNMDDSGEGQVVVHSEFQQSC